MNLIRGKNKN